MKFKFNATKPLESIPVTGTKDLLSTAFLPQKVCQELAVSILVN